MQGLTPKKITVREFRQWVAHLVSLDPQSNDGLEQVILGMSVYEIAMMCELKGQNGQKPTIEQRIEAIEDMEFSELSALADECRKVNDDFLSKRDLALKTSVRRVETEVDPANRISSS